MTVLRSVSCATWPIAVGSPTPTALRPATLPVASCGVEPERAAAAVALLDDAFAWAGVRAAAIAAGHPEEVKQLVRLRRRLAGAS